MLALFYFQWNMAARPILGPLMGKKKIQDIWIQGAKSFFEWEDRQEEDDGPVPLFHR